MGPYAIDDTWRPHFPSGAHTFSGVAVGAHDRVYVTQRGNLSVAPVLVLSGSSGKVIASMGTQHISVRSQTWGSHGVQVETRANGKERVWIADLFAHSLFAYTPSGAFLLAVGTGKGNSTNPSSDIFDAVADVACNGAGELYVSDGDGGSNNRVLQLYVPHKALERDVTVGWVTPPLFFNPHSVALHARSGQLLVSSTRARSAPLRCLEYVCPCRLIACISSLTWPAEHRSLTASTAAPGWYVPPTAPTLARGTVGSTAAAARSVCASCTQAVSTCSLLQSTRPPRHLPPWTGPQVCQRSG